MPKLNTTYMRITTSKVKNAKQLNYSRQQTSFLKIKKSIKTDLYYLFKQKKRLINTKF